jgi:hypothetical protein
VQLLVAVVHHEELLDDVLSTLVELELPDSVVVESSTGLELLERDLPIFAGLRSLIPGGLDFSRMVLCLIDEDELGRSAVEAVARLGGHSTGPGEPRNSVFLLPVADAQHF